ncbi:PAS domain-containing protein [Kiloniella antarctica]|uniref:PAS domain-containing protein n=1 Tax=Kiloniella antarctica TaxID=1550907 RepID=A0ABW5BIE2_9PROT
MVDFKHTKNQAFYDYWLSLPKEGILPHRHNFMPEDVPSLLSSMVIYELVSESFIKIRLLGSSIEDRYGLNRTGSNYLDLVENPRRLKASQALWSQAEKPCGMHTFLEQELKTGRRAYLEAVGLPVMHDRDGIPLLIFQSNEVVNEHKTPDKKLYKEPDKKNDKEKSPLKAVRIVKRSFFDLGAGVPDFRD